MTQSHSTGKPIPEINLNNIVTFTCDLCGRSIEAYIYNKQSYDRNTQKMIDARVSGNHTAARALELDVLGWVCPNCGFTTCKAGKHGKEQGGKFWSMKDPTCFNCHQPLPIEKNLLLVARKRALQEKPGILQRIFGKPDTKQTYKERDNRGTRHETAAETRAYWQARNQSPIKEPFVLYTFKTETDARSALLELPCIHIAADSGKPICAETLLYGYYPVEEGGYDAFICGSDLSHALWKQAKESFIRHGGRPRGQGDLEPNPTPAAADRKKTAGPNLVKFIKEERQTKQVGAMTVTFIYKIYRGPDAASAKEFLATQTVSQNHVYIIVETPEGNYGLDIDGIYKE